jgi:coproporphyrinogen III oxidase
VRGDGHVDAVDASAPVPEDAFDAIAPMPEDRVDAVNASAPVPEDAWHRCRRIASMQSMQVQQGRNIDACTVRTTCVAADDWPKSDLRLHGCAWRRRHATDVHGEGATHTFGGGAGLHQKIQETQECFWYTHLCKRFIQEYQPEESYPVFVSVLGG